MRARPDVQVIGAGVIGLTTAICLAEASLAVRVRTKHPPRKTTSCAADAIWAPYLGERRPGPSLERAHTVDIGRPGRCRGTGVRLVNGLEASRNVITPPEWATNLESFRPCDPHRLPPGFASGWWYTAPVVDMPVYLDYLVARLLEAGGEIGYEAVASLADAAAQAPITVNCTGVAARDFVPDPEVVPSRGQLVVVRNPGVDWFFVEHEELRAPTYFLPHGPDVMVLGGSTEPGRVDLDPDREVSEAIQRRCATVEPLIAGAEVLEHRVGLRPYRPRVRLERVEIGSHRLVHNYGHGGSGVTLSWGCAREVLQLIN